MATWQKMQGKGSTKREALEALAKSAGRMSLHDVKVRWSAAAWAFVAVGYVRVVR